MMRIRIGDAFYCNGAAVARCALLAAAAWLNSLSLASACEIVPPDPSPLETRKPARGKGVYFAASFGVRTHPVLQIPRLHAGVDWAAPLGTPVIAAGRGRVISADVEGAYGKRVIIDHGGSWQTLYAHLSAIKVGTGDCVEAGTVIGSVGATGLAASTHVHFEVRRDGQPVDPMVLPLRSTARQREIKR